MKQARAQWKFSVKFLVILSMVTLSGIVQRPQEKDRIEGVVRNAFTTVGLKHEGFINELKLPNR